jgi:hypothetical protein
MMSGPLNQDHGFGRKVHTRAIPQVQHALADAGAPPAERTPAKAESLLVNHKANVHSGTHPSFPNTKRALRAEIFASNRAPVTDSHIYRDYKTRLESDVEGLHDKYKPQVISETKDANGEVLTSSTRARATPSSPSTGPRASSDGLKAPACGTSATWASPTAVTPARLAPTCRTAPW